MHSGRAWVSRRACGAAGAGAVLTAITVVLASGCGSQDPPTAAGPSPSTIVTSTTRIAGAGVLGNDRRPDESCAPEPAPLDEGPDRREVRNATAHAVSPPVPESTLVPADPQRIVALSGDQLDALCALGLQSRIVGAALPDGSDSQPSYLGTAVHDLPAVGSRSDPDLAAVRGARPDLILGSVALTPTDHPELSAVAPTVFTGPPGDGWQDVLRAVAAATGRGATADRLIGDFEAAADRTGADSDATHFQASVVQFTDTTMRILGPATFAGSVLAAAGVDRPPAQRFTDKPYLEIGTSDADLDDRPDFSAAEGDIVYVSFATAQARERAPKVMGSDAWKRLSATRDNRVFAVNNEVWQTGEGIVAARGVLDDLRWVNAPIN